MLLRPAAPVMSTFATPIRLRPVRSSAGRPKSLWKICAGTVGTGKPATTKETNNRYTSGRDSADESLPLFIY